MEKRTDATRRTMLGATVLGSAATSVGAGAQTRTTGKVFVLVHGAWHGGWCWRPVADLLEAQGHRVLTPTLTGLGERSHLLSRQTGVSLHVADICNVLAWEDLREVVLVGHSYAGIVVSGVAEQMADRIASIIFLDAFVPADGEALIDTTPPEFSKVLSDAWARGEAGFPSPPVERFGVGADQKAWVESKLTPQPLAAFFEKAHYAGGREKIARKAYIRLLGYPMPRFDEKLARARSDRSWRTLELSAGHDAMITAPDALTRALLSLA